MNLLIPALLFVRVLDAATIDLLRSAWLAAVLPFFYVPCGALLGALCVLLTQPGEGFETGMIAAVTFGNSTGLPIIILSVVNDALMSREIRALTARHAHGDVPPTDPLVYLSIYSLTYPLLQWSIGNALLSGSCRLRRWRRAEERPVLTSELMLSTETANVGEAIVEPPARRRSMDRTTAVAQAPPLSARAAGAGLPCVFSSSAAAAASTELTPTRAARLESGHAWPHGTPLRAPPPTPSARSCAWARGGEGGVLDGGCGDGPGCGDGVGIGGAGITSSEGGGPQRRACAVHRGGGGDEHEHEHEGSLRFGAAPLLRARTMLTPRSPAVKNTCSCAGGEHAGGAQPAGQRDAGSRCVAEGAEGRHAWARGGSNGRPAAGHATLAPTLGRAMSEPAGLLPEQHPWQAAAARRGAPAEHSFLLHYGTHMRTARAAGANNLNAVADGEVGRIAPPMREADLRVYDPTTGALGIEHISFYVEGSQRHGARARASTDRSGGNRSARTSLGGAARGAAANDGADGAPRARAAQPRLSGLLSPLALLPSGERRLSAWQRLGSAEFHQPPHAGLDDGEGSARSGSGSGSESEDDDDWLDGARSPMRGPQGAQGVVLHASLGDTTAAEPPLLPLPHKDNGTTGRASAAAQPAAALSPPTDKLPRACSGRASPLHNCGHDESPGSSSSVQSLTSPPPAPPPGVSAREPERSRLPPASPSAGAHRCAPSPREEEPQQAQAQRFKEHARHHGSRRARASWRCARDAAAFVFDKLLVPPVRATLLGLALGLLPCTRELLVTESWQEEPAPLAWLRLGLSKLGDAAVPTNLITLGASLASGPDFTALSVKSCAAIVVAKLLVMPAIAMAAVAAVDRSFPVQILHPFQQPFYLTMFVVAATPTANNVLIMCTIAGQDRTAMSTAIFVQYVCSPVILTVTICFFIKIMVDIL